MVLIIDGHKFHYEMENLCRVFFPNEKIEIRHDSDINSYDNNVVLTSYETNQGDKTTVYIEARINNEIRTDKAQIAINDNVDIELKMAVMLFHLLCDITQYRPQWGVLTGVRPSKLMTKLISEMGEQQAKNYFIDNLLVTPKKTALAIAVSKKESEIIALSRPESFSLYISIPFCPSRCSYCSLVSHSITSPTAKKMLPDYLELLNTELLKTAEIAKGIGLRLESIYIGGGTPSILDTMQTENLLNTVCKSFDLSNMTEFTFEAGRPDTINKEKLEVINNSPVSRISINPQTFNDEVLQEIGRKHTSQDIIDVYELARETGFKDINMDIIAGLPNDSLNSFENTLKTLLKLSPSNITVHTLALKRAAELADNAELSFRGNIASSMVELANDMLSNNGYNPYYMYRQSKSVGNLENVGWCKNGFEGRYNVFMMEECHTVLAAGAGAVTKLKAPYGNHIERIFNFKYPYEYINRYEEILERKNEVSNFYKLNKFGGQ